MNCQTEPSNCLSKARMCRASTGSSSRCHRSVDHLISFDAARSANHKSAIRFSRPFNSASPNRPSKRSPIASMYIMNQPILLISIYLILLSAQSLVNAYSTGAPDRACSTLIPQHNADPQRYFPSPYIITANKLGYNHGSREFNVSITAKTDSFKGFILQARDYHDPDNLVSFRLENWCLLF